MLLWVILACSVVANPPTVDVSVRGSAEHVLHGVLNSIHAQIEVNTSQLDNGQAKRPPFNIAVVLDRSGSMSGEKLHHAKKAVEHIIHNLTPEDRLHLVTYSTRAQVTFRSDASQEVMLQKLHDVYASGGTNLHAGLEQGYELVSKDTTTGDKQRVSRVFLFSDGLVNIGVTSAGALQNLAKAIHKEDSVTTSAFGIGEDFDENLMVGIAEAGHGDYFFIADEPDTEKVVSVGLKGVLNLVGKEGRLTLRGVNGGVITKVYGHPTESLVNGITLGDLRAGSSKRIVFNVDVTPTPKLVEDTIVEWTLTYIPVNEAGTGATVEHKGVWRVKFTDDGKKVEAGKDTWVLEVVEIQQAMERQKEVQKLMEKGDFGGSVLLTEANEKVFSKYSERHTGARVQKRRQDTLLKSLQTTGLSQRSLRTSNYYNNMEEDSAFNEL